MNFVSRTLAVALFLSLSCVVVLAQSANVDPAFAPVPSLAITSNDLIGKGIMAQADGKAVVWGGNYAVDGKPLGQLARLNADGSLDTSFAYCGCLLDTVNNAYVQTDGKVLVAGVSFGQAKIVRLNTNGTQDTSFNSVFDGLQALSSAASILTVLPDGRILANVTGSYASGFHDGSVRRLNSDGSTDTGFTNMSYDGGRLIFGGLRDLAVDPTSGKMYMATVVTSGTMTYQLQRRNANGTVDGTWEQPTFTPGNNTAAFNSLAVQSNGSLVISGRFDSVNGLSKVDVVRLAPAGNVDMDFTAPAMGAGGGQIGVLAGDKLLVSYNLAGPNRLLRLNSNGSLDNTFTLSSSVTDINSRWSLDGSGRIYFLGNIDQVGYRFTRLNPNGDLDAGYAPNVTLFGKVTAQALQTDGRIVVVGDFNRLNGIARQNIGRINSDGTLDSSFNVGTGFSSAPRRLVVQTDGKILAAGAFSSFNGGSQRVLVRLNTDGSVDSAFAPVIPTGSISGIGLQSDGRILIGGNFTTVNGVARTGVARLNSDGTLDNAFNPTFGSPAITEIFQQPDGKIIVGGGFSGVNGFNRAGMVRLGDDGSLDQTFNATGIGAVSRVWRQADGKYFFSSGTTVGRRNIDGTADGTLASPVFDTTGSNGRSIDDVILQPDGTFIVGGRFDIVGGVTKRNIVRLTSAGAVDPLFAPIGTDAPVRTLLRQADGRIVIGGEYSKIESVVRAGMARMSVSLFVTATRFDFDGDGKADVAVYRPSSGVWYELFSSGNPYGSPTFGLAGDIPVPADYDGDGKTDLAIFRPSTGVWWYLTSSTGQIRATNHGQAGDVPVPQDMNNDGTDDFVLFRPSTNAWMWYTTTGGFSSIGFGLAGDKPVIGDFDGDGKGDPAVFRPSTGDWWYAASGSFYQHRSMHWGATGDVAAPADFDGDGKTDMAVFRPSNGAWYIFKSSDQTYIITGFGLNGDRPVPADYDGDGRADIAVYRPSDGTWYLMQSTNGITGFRWGVATDVAVPNAFTQQ